MCPARRRAFSLLEVLLASGLLLGAVVVLGQMARLGLRAAAQARALTEAQHLCEAHLAEIAAGIAPLPEASGDFEPLAQRAGWLARVERWPTEHPDLVAVRVTVRQDLPEGKRPLEVSLVQWVSGAAPREQPAIESAREPSVAQSTAAAR